MCADHVGLGDELQVLDDRRPDLLPQRPREPLEACVDIRGRTVIIH